MYKPWAPLCCRCPHSQELANGTAPVWSMAGFSSREKTLAALTMTKTQPEVTLVLTAYWTELVTHTRQKDKGVKF